MHSISHKRIKSQIDMCEHVSDHQKNPHEPVTWKPEVSDPLEPKSQVVRCPV